RSPPAQSARSVDRRPTSRAKPSPSAPRLAFAACGRVAAKPTSRPCMYAIRASIRALFLSVCILQLSGCASEPTVTAAQAQIPPIPAGLARVWVLRQFEPGLGVQWTPMTYINGAPLASSYAGTAFYRDLQPGTYSLTVESCSCEIFHTHS